MGPLPETPSFDSLPMRRDGPRGNAWGLFGQDDQLGMLNRLTPENTIEASKEIMYGLRISTDLPLDQLKTPCFNRLAFHQQIQHKAPRTVNDDVLTLNTQSSSQWDGFRHFGERLHVTLFNWEKDLTPIVQDIKITKSISTTANKRIFTTQLRMELTVNIPLCTDIRLTVIPSLG